MSGRLLLGVALVAHVFVVVICTDPPTQASIISPSSETSPIESANAISSVIPTKGKCRRVKKCPKNEEFSYCAQSLQRAQYCSEKGQSYKNSAPDTTSCKEACVCKENYLRDDNGTCIPAKECPITCGDNEVLDNCPADCPSDYCPTEEKDEAALCVTPDVCPPPACKCAFNHRRAFNGTCIPTRSCPPFDCSAKPNEEFDPCPPLCPTDDCSQASPSGKCPRFGNIGIVLQCSPQCRCMKGYWRLDGVCVPYEQCPGVCPTNERYSECIQSECRPLNCTQKAQSVPCIRLDPEYCLKGCICENGYLRNENRLCVPQDQCELKKCPKNEEFSYCTQSLQRAQYCSEKGQSYKNSAPDTTSCKEACVCKENYLRDDNGTCIPAKECPITCGDNEVLDNCPADCPSDYCPTEEKDEAALCVTPDVCPPPACKCAFNHRRAFNGTCIPTRSCPPFDCSAKPNEEFDPCPPLCPTDDCSQASPSGKCPPLFGNIGIVLQCNPQCRCIKGYWRLDGVCVPYEQCPGVCPANERYSACIQGECRALNCTQKDQSVPCIRLDPQYCVKGCVCEEGYLRNENGLCVPQDQCAPPACPPNEQFSDCTQIICRAQKCKEKDWPIACPGIVEGSCIKGCVCQEGYLRDDNGDCIPDDQCIPNPCQPNEVFSNCTQAICRAQNCTDKGIPQACPSVADGDCLGGCVCQEGYLRTEDGYCVPEDQCTANLCSFNEEWSECIQATCRAQNCTQKGMSVACPGVADGDCISGCVCKENYLRDESGFCVDEEDCNKEEDSCGENQEMRCVQSCPPEKSCRNRDIEIPCLADLSPCENKCVCKPGFIRNDEWECVPEKQCAPSCPANEEFVPCVQGVCRAMNCSQKGENVPCPDIPSETCDSGCVCKENFYRTDDGTCVPEDQCQPTCPPKEQFSECTQIVCRAQKCKEKDWPIACPGIVEGSCIKGCVCQEGYLRNDDGDCIPDDQCIPNPCQPNEVFSNCTQAICRAQNCSDKGIAQACPSVADGDCLGGCVCQEGYLRTEDGYCVPEDQCTANLCSLNEEWSECIQATCRAQNCTQKGMPVACPGVADGDCISGCVCREYFLRDESGFCVSEEECNKKEDPCGQNQEMRCVQWCPPEKSCRNRDIGISCIAVYRPCEFKCVCKPGFIRNDKNECVPEKECDTCTGANEFFACDSACDNECATLATQNRTNCPIRNIVCNRKCYCEDGYARDDKGNCIPIDQCPQSCPANEEFVPCVQGVCRAMNCSQRGDNVPCPDIPSEICDSGCVCKENFLRAEDGTCVPEDQCQPPTCPRNEQFTDCTQTVCRAQKCIEKDWPIACPSVSECIKGCVCQVGYLRDDNGDCIAENECIPNPCQPNEEYSDCTQAICRAQNCSDKGMPQACPSVADGDCLGGCVCQEGYLRSEDGYCVPEDQCTANLCSLNEEWSECIQATCRAQNCTQKGMSVACPGVADGDCISGCVCKENYLRDESGLCVYEEDCNKTNTCPANEELSDCAEAICRPQNCTQRGLVLPCPSVTNCTKACVCKDNYLRDENGNCVPEEQCPPQITCSENEVLESCPSNCTSEFCPKSPDEKDVCLPSSSCTPACKCRFNYRRAENGTCIPTRSCPPFACDDRPNEQYVSCPPYCPTDDCSQARLKGRCPFRIGVILECAPKCQCKNGYGRVNGTCVPFEECPNLCPANEVYSSCMQKTCRPQKCSERDETMKTCSRCDDIPCERGCVCQENYFRNEKGVCVSYEECEAPLCPNANEIYTPNFKECPPNICNALVSRYACDENQKEGPGCLCASGYLRLNTSSPCIPICDCPEMAFSPDCIH